MRRTLLCGVLVVVVIVSMSLGAFAGDDLSFERQRARMMLDVVAKEIQTNFYDTGMKGLDWNAKVTEARDRIDKATSIGQLFTAIFVLVDSLQDSHTMFLPPGRATTYSFGYDAQPIGDRVLVTQVKKGREAEKAGLRLGDQIRVMNGYNVTRENFSLMKLYFKALRPVTRSELIVTRGTDPKPIQILVDASSHVKPRILDVTKIETIWQLIREAESDEEKPQYARFPDEIGYLKPLDFVFDTEYLDYLIGKVEKQKAVIIDLRSNPGGSVETLKRFIGHFITEPSSIFEIQKRKGNEMVTAKPVKPGFTGPMYILVNAESASAAEIFARYFQLSKRATVIGDRSSGRVTVSHFYQHQLGAGTVVLYGVQVAIGRAVFSNGEELEKRGVTPDVACLPTPGDLAAEKDVCLGTAVAMARLALSAPSDKPKVEATTGKSGQ
jgi:C-terminal processing protease CtpA/Prc